MPLTAYGVNMVTGPLVLLHVVVVLELAQDLKLPRHQMAVLHVQAQKPRQNLAAGMHVQVVKH